MNHLGRRLIAVLEPGPRSDNYVIAVLQVAGPDFDLARGFDAETNRDNLNRSGRFHQEDARGASRAIHGLYRNGKHVFALLGDEIHLGVHAGDQPPRWMWT